jgi:hypothetical protein
MLLAEFSQANALYRDEDGTGLIDRHRNSSEAAATPFASWDDQIAKRLIGLCFEANSLVRHFNEMVEYSRRWDSKREVYLRALADIRELLKETQDPPRGPLAAFVTPDPHRIQLEIEALGSMKKRIEDQDRIANETILRFGATRKSHGKKAAETAVIGWISEGVRRITNEANFNLCVDLAELVLSCEVSLDRVKNAAKTRQREFLHFIPLRLVTVEPGIGSNFSRYGVIALPSKQYAERKAFGVEAVPRKPAVRKVRRAREPFPPSRAVAHEH